MQFYNTTHVYEVLLGALVDDPNVDCLAIQVGGLHPTDMEQLARLFSGVIERGKLLVTWQIDPVSGRVMTKQLELRRVPVYPSAERAIRALGALYRYHTMQEAIK
jgi:acyl-CoA synthetase (NDP forming)